MFESHHKQRLICLSQAKRAVLCTQRDVLSQMKQDLGELDDRLAAAYIESPTSVEAARKGVAISPTEDVTVEMEQSTIALSSQIIKQVEKDRRRFSVDQQEMTRHYNTEADDRKKELKKNFDFTFEIERNSRKEDKIELVSALASNQEDSDKGRDSQRGHETLLSGLEASAGTKSSLV